VVAYPEFGVSEREIDSLLLSRYGRDAGTGAPPAGGARGATGTPNFGRSVNPIPTSPPFTNGTPQIFKPSGIPGISPLRFEWLVIVLWLKYSLIKIRLESLQPKTPLIQF
jgi:hypothetical protein